jgi:hypothetical protein
MAKEPEPPKLFWITYRHSDRRADGVVVIESNGLLHARLKASLAGADRELEFASGHQLDPVSAEMIPANMTGRFLDEGDLRKVHRAGLFRSRATLQTEVLALRHQLTSLSAAVWNWVHYCHPFGLSHCSSHPMAS